LSSSAAASAVALLAVGSHHLPDAADVPGSRSTLEADLRQSTAKQGDILPLANGKTERIDQRWTSVFIEQITASTKVDLP
jgi:hypothetical protein